MYHTLTVKQDNMYVLESMNKGVIERFETEKQAINYANRYYPNEDVYVTKID